MRAFLELLATGRSIADLDQLAPQLAPGELDALRAEGFLQPTGTARFEEVSVPDVIRAVRALWGAGSGGMRTRATMSHAPMHLGWFEIDDEPCELVLVNGDAHSLAAAARRRERALVLVPTDHAITPALRQRHGSRARVRFVVLCECLGVHRGRVCRVDLPVPMPAPLPARGHASDAQPAPRARSTRSRAPIFEGCTRWGDLTVLEVDSHTVLVRFGRRSLRVTAEDLGLAGKSSRQPIAPFRMLLAFCDGGGCFKSRRFGGAKATKTTLSRLRRKLREAFGIDEDPFFDFERGVGWRARFLVGDGESEREASLSPRAREVLERAGMVRRR
jgi:hypothetical protein